MKAIQFFAAAGLALAVPGTASAVSISVDVSQSRRPVSPYIYGFNGVPRTSGGQPRLAAQPLVRSGGNRLTGYNWENNASNAGTDWGPNASDDLMCGWCSPGQHETAGEGIRVLTNEAHALGRAILVTLPIADYVAADKNGNVTQPATVDPSRWKVNRARKGAAPSLSPNKTDGFVNQDEFVNFMETSFASARAAGKEIFYSLDNEPALWPYTHPMLHPSAPTYAEMASRTVDYGSMVKDRNPNALVFGGVCYGYAEFMNLQNAPDAAGRDYLDFLLDAWAAADGAQGRRVVDVLDLHWYPEAQGGGVRITEEGPTPTNPSPGLIQARLQAPRSLWDPTYVENSWVAGATGGAIRLLNRLEQKTSTRYPGTKLAFTEYNYGGAEHVSGGLAQADVLGVFGREGVFAASLWELNGDATSFILGGFDMYMNYDGAGTRVGDTSVSVANADPVKTSVYALVDAGDDGKVWVVAVNKTTSTETADITIANPRALSSVAAYQLTSSARTPQAAGTASVTGNHLVYLMPPLSATTLVFSGAPMTGGAPPAPTALTATAVSSSQIDLSWTDVVGETGYKVERAAAGTGAFSQIAVTGANAAAYQDFNRPAGTHYDYRVRAFNGFGDSGYSPEVEAATAVLQPQSGGGSGAPGPMERMISPGAREGVNDGVVFTDAAEVDILDSRGRRVFQGANDPVWEGQDASGRGLPAGLYIARVRARDGKIRYEKIMVVK